MDFLKVPSFYFEPKVVIVDDDVGVLEILKSSMSSFDLTVFDDPEFFVEHIKLLKNNTITNKHLEINENSSEIQSGINLNLNQLSQQLEKSFYYDNFISVAFIDYFMPFMTGIDCIRQISDIQICKVLLTASLDSKDVISAFNEGLIDQFISKETDNLVEKMCDIVIKTHLSVIEKLNQRFFGHFSTLNLYADLFSDKKFISYFKNILLDNNIKFSCVYECYGSMVMIDRHDTKYFINIYSEDEVNSLLYENAEFENKVSEYNKNLCREFKLLVDYKNNNNYKFFDYDLSNKITENFELIVVKNKNYYVTLKKSIIE